MTDFILFMHNDVPEGPRCPDGDGGAYFAKLREAGAFQGGSSIGDGICASKSSPPGTITGYIRIRAERSDGRFGELAWLPTPPKETHDETGGPDA